MRYLYSILLYLALPFLFIRLLWRSRRDAAYRYRWAERVGCCPHRLTHCIWVHAASVGETLAAIPLIKALKVQYPHLPLVVSNMTITGGVRTKAAFGDSVLQVYIPYDAPDAAARFLDRIHPKLAIIIETELWPNLFYACAQRKIPIVVANARLSKKSAAGYHRVASLTREMLSAVHALAAQTQMEADRFIALGLPAERVMVAGSIKFDVELPPDLTAQRETLWSQLGPDRLIWIAASTHEGEEAQMLEAHRLIAEKIPNALLLLVPRHPERFDTVFALTEQKGFNTVRRSSGLSCTPETEVYLGDTMGELLLLFAASDVAFVAGSFIPLGGHNMLEAAVLGKPIIMGPHLFNFADISQKLIAANAMLVVQDATALAEAVIHFMQDTDYRNSVGANAKHVVDANRGSLTKQLALIQTVYPA